MIYFFDLTREEINTKKALEEQIEMIKKIRAKEFLFIEEKSINEEKTKGAIKKAKTRTQTKKKF